MSRLVDTYPPCDVCGSKSMYEHEGLFLCPSCRKARQKSDTEATGEDER